MAIGNGGQARGGPVTPRLSLHAVTVRFGAHEVLRDVSFDVPVGQTLAVIGESGCGKTVLLKLLVGLLAPIHGEVRLDGQCVQRLGDRELASVRQRIGLLFQGAALFDSLSVFDNIAFGLRARCTVSEPEIGARVRQQLASVGLAPAVAGKLPSELSGGMRKRVGLARALALDPDLMLYDEPTTGLDPVMTAAINELILRTRRPNRTSIIVTHEMRTVQDVADRVIMLRPASRLGDGRPQVIFDGPPRALAESQDAQVREFLR